MNRPDHLPPADHDGTAINWDTERARGPLDPLLDDLAWCAIACLGWFVLGVAVTGLAFGWWLP